MESTVTERGQTAIPAALRKKYGLKAHMKLVWVDTGGGIRVVPVPTDAVKSFRGMFKGLGLTESLLKDRREELEREQRIRRRH
ncbi:MAG: AbrB/MazE/SpoVT family DNA-binding domain-containing protein [Candidatus Omnitrophota bacterium]|nr:AbrB/MazE/SpoVT family DNA-binding domain-containing protein [Candidatus Omnitrophota bacterium]